jgi:hypothetical protein
MHEMRVLLKMPYGGKMIKSSVFPWSIRSDHTIRSSSLTFEINKELLMTGRE